MATDNTVKVLNERIDKALHFDRKRLIRRQEWGTISFERGQRDFDRIFQILEYLKNLPVELLVDSTAQEISNSVEECRVYLNQIDTFTLESSGTPIAVRDQYLAQLAQGADTLFLRASPWIPFLAYQKGDVSKNITDLSSAVNQAKDIVEDAKNRTAAKSLEIDEIIAKAREASGAAGAAVFTKDFAEQAEKLEDQSKTWLITTLVVALGTLGGSILAFFLIDPDMGKIAVVQRLAAKVAIYGVLITATVWCGRNYKALKHQAATYRFKSLGLQTFQAFTAGSANEQTKDAVLLETTRSIFASHQTGYIDEDSGGDTKIIEVLKSTLPSGGSS